jgi:hypothetical protein
MARRCRHRAVLGAGPPPNRAARRKRRRKRRRQRRSRRKRRGKRPIVGKMSGALAAEGAEWQPGRAYDIVHVIGGEEGRQSVVFRIRLRPPRRGEYALTMVCR